MQGAGKLDRSDNSRLRHTQMVRGDWHRSASNHRAVFRKAPLSLQFWIIITGRAFPFHPTFRPSFPSIIRALLVRFLYSEIRGEYLSIDFWSLIFLGEGFDRGGKDRTRLNFAIRFEFYQRISIRMKVMKIYRYRFQREFDLKLFGIVLIQIPDILRRWWIPERKCWKYERAKIHDPCQQTMTFVKLVEDRVCFRARISRI